MKSQPIQEFKSTPFVDVLASVSGANVTWESPRLTTMYPVEGRPVGSDRAVCHTVNGILRVRVNDHSIFNAEGVIVTAGLWGEYAGVSNLIQSTTYRLYPKSPLLGALDVDPIFKYHEIGTDYLTFDVWNTFSNLAQNIYIRLSFVRNFLGEVVIPPPPTPINVTLSGVLIGSDLG
jgi:hypothetical protein